MSSPPAVHLAIPVDDLVAARRFHAEVLGMAEGRSTDRWIDRNLHGHQPVTHLVPMAPTLAGTSEVEQHRVPIPHFGLLLDEDGFHDPAGDALGLTSFRNPTVVFAR